MSEDEVTNVIDDPGEGTSANRLLPRSYEFNPVYHEYSEVESDTVGVRGKRLNIRERSSSSEGKQPGIDDDAHNDPLWLIEENNLYELEKYGKNAMIIFYYDQRTGTLRDVDTLKLTFEKFDFEVETRVNLERKYLFDVLRSFCSRDFSRYGCVCITILTESSERGLLYAYDMDYDVRDVVKMFDMQGNPSLFGKPIIILIELKLKPTTRLNSISPHISLDNSDHYNLPTIPPASDILIFRSCSNEHFRTENGSWFIQTLCRKIRALADVADLEAICGEVKREIALDMNYKLWDDTNNEIVKQLPIMSSSLLKRLYLRKYEGNDFSPVGMGSKSYGKMLTGRKTPKKYALELNPDDVVSFKQTKKEYCPNVNAPTYELEKFTKNCMIIFNHEHFLDDYTRKGTALDEAALRDTFERFRFDVMTHDDLNRTQLLEELKQFSKQDFNSCGCICIAILTHGSDHGYLRAFDMWYSEREVFGCFDALVNPTLVAKPIIFLIQACRGPKLALSVPVPPPYLRPKIELDYSVKRDSRCSLPSESDMIILHSCFFGRASARVPDKGSWFIQTLCEQIKLHAATEHLEKITRRVRNIIALEKEFNQTKQVPVATSTLLRKLFFKPNEDSETES